MIYNIIITAWFFISTILIFIGGNYSLLGTTMYIVLYIVTLRKEKKDNG